jgi:hypothetical protein
MKNQYVGDFKDYLKYGILRGLANEGGLQINVCWMLTENDDSRHGDDLRHLGNRRAWQDFDRPLFEALHRIVCMEADRRVVRIRDLNIVPRGTFFEEVLTDDRSTRDTFFEGFRSQRNEADLVFFDPDVGIERRSTPQPGRKKSSKYVYWKELRECFEAGHSLMVFQFFLTKPNRTQVEERFLEFGNRLLISHQMLALSTVSNVVFYLIPQECAIHDIRRTAEAIQKSWCPYIELLEWLSAD